MKKLKAFIKNLFRKPFIVKTTGAYARYGIEHGCKIILYRTKVKYPSPSASERITFGTGVVLDLKKGYCGIVEPKHEIGKTGLISCNAPKVIMPGDTSEVELDFYMNPLPYYSELPNSKCPFDLKQTIGYITIVKTV